MKSAAGEGRADDGFWRGGDRTQVSLPRIGLFERQGRSVRPCGSPAEPIRQILRKGPLGHSEDPTYARRTSLTEGPWREGASSANFEVLPLSAASQFAEKPRDDAGIAFAKEERIAKVSERETDASPSRERTVYFQEEEPRPRVQRPWRGARKSACDRKSCTTPSPTPRCGRSWSPDAKRQARPNPDPKSDQRRLPPRFATKAAG